VPQRNLINAFSTRMRSFGMSPAAIASFELHYERLCAGDRGVIAENEIEPIEILPDADDLVGHLESGRSALARVVVIKLNGGLGTGMGLARAKSLLTVRDGLSFLDLIARQVLALRARVGREIPLLLMNSFRTGEDSEKALATYPELARSDLPSGFLQNMVPKVLAHNLEPADNPSNPGLEWCPPGHGDLYTAIADSGLLPRLLDLGIDYAFVSNADNLGATLDPVLLGYMDDQGFHFMLEAADRTPADRKGGHLCRLVDGRLALRESAQCPSEAADAFQDVDRYRYFNTNNLWIYLPALAELLADQGGFLPLPTVVNSKTLDPQDPTSEAVYQLETVMGTAISLFDRATAVRVPRTRFSPVKNTNDLLAVRSDAYQLNDDSRIVLHPDRTTPPVIRLDDRYFKMIDHYERRFPHGSPSLKACRSLTVEGDVTFGSDIAVVGDAVVHSVSENSTLPNGTVLRRVVEI
jgi:UTP--glucose-1-phosphate uridylyltransferase